MLIMDCEYLYVYMYIYIYHYGGKQLTIMAGTICDTSQQTQDSEG
jgi:hypothetical protein